MMSTDTAANVTSRWWGAHPAARSPRDVALALLALWLVTSATILGLNGHARLAALNAAIAMCALAAVDARLRLPATLGDALALLVAPALYAELPMLIQIAGMSFHDGAVQRLELSIFGEHPARTFASTVPSLPLSELLHAGYLAYYPLIVVPPALLLFLGRRRDFGMVVLALTATFLTCWTSFIVFPVEGPRFLWGPAAAPDGFFRRTAVHLLANASSRGTAFPSSHVAVSAAQSLVASRSLVRLRIPLWCTTALIAAGAVYGGFHYAVDTIAGLLLGIAIGLLVLRLGSPSSDDCGA